MLSADVGNKHGFNTHGVVFDELHTQPNRKLYDVMTKGSGDARMQPLYFLITTAGDNQNSICWEKEKSTKKIDGAVATIMALDRAIRCGNDTGESVYDKRGLLIL